jgi:hypothetical protein
MEQLAHLNYLRVPMNQIFFSYKNNSDAPNNSVTANSTLISHIYLARNINHSPAQTSHQRIQYQSNTMFWLPITETEIERVIRSLRGKSSAGFDEIPEYLANKCLHYIKKP